MFCIYIRPSPLPRLSRILSLSPAFDCACAYPRTISPFLFDLKFNTICYSLRDPLVSHLLFTPRNTVPGFGSTEYAFLFIYIYLYLFNLFVGGASNMHFPFREKLLRERLPAHRRRRPIAQRCSSPIRRHVFRCVAPLSDDPSAHPTFFTAVDRKSLFAPTPESIPPPDVSYRQNTSPGLPVHRHPLVRPFTLLLTRGLTVQR